MTWANPKKHRRRNRQDAGRERIRLRWIRMLHWMGRVSLVAFFAAPVGGYFLAGWQGAVVGTVASVAILAGMKQFDALYSKR